MAALSQVDKPGISRHLKNTLVSNELQWGSIIATFAAAASDNKVCQVEHCNLEAIISVR